MSGFGLKITFGGRGAYSEKKKLLYAHNRIIQLPIHLIWPSVFLIQLRYLHF